MKRILLLLVGLALLGAVGWTLSLGFADGAVATQPVEKLIPADRYSR